MMEQWLTENWILAGIIAFLALLAGSLLKTVFGNILRYILFIGMAAVVYKIQTEAADYSFITAELLAQFAAIAVMAYVPTFLIVFLFFRRSRIGGILFPIIGFGLIFAVSSAFTF